MNEIENLQQLSEEELLVMIGRDLVSKEKPALPFTRLILVKRAKEWLTDHYEKFAELVCENETVRAFAGESDDVRLALAIAELIASVCANVAPITVAYLLVKRGVSSLCKRYWKLKN